METKNVFEVLNSINVNEKTEKKNGLTYLSWAWAWAEVKKNFPDATYTIYENANGLFYHTDGKTCWVKTGVTIGGIEYIEYLPVMDYRNASIGVDKVTSFDVNKAIQRSLTKACARHGLGLYIYAGEDLPEGESSNTSSKDNYYTKLQEVVEALNNCKTIAELCELREGNKQFYKEKSFIAAGKAAVKRLNDEYEATTPEQVKEIQDRITKEVEGEK